MKTLNTKKKFILGTVIGMMISSVSACYIVNVTPIKKALFKDNQNYSVANAEAAANELYNNTRTYQSIKEDMLETIYPIGSIYVSTSLSTVSQVENALGGTWVSYGDGRLLRGSTSASEQTNDVTGSVTLAATNIPSHTHDMSHVHSITAHNHSLQSHTHSYAHTHGVPGVAHNHGTSSMSAAIGSGYSAPHTIGFMAVNASGGNSTYTIASISGGSQAQGHPNRSHNTKIVGTTDNATPAATTTNSQSASTTSGPSTANTGTASAFNSGAANTSVSSDAANTGSTGESTPSSFSTTDAYITAYIYKRTA